MKKEMTNMMTIDTTVYSSLIHKEYGDGNYGIALFPNGDVWLFDGCEHKKLVSLEEVANLFNRRYDKAMWEEGEWRLTLSEYSQRHGYTRHAHIYLRDSRVTAADIQFLLNIIQENWYTVPGKMWWE